MTAAFGSKFVSLWQFQAAEGMAGRRGGERNVHLVSSFFNNVRDGKTSAFNRASGHQTIALFFLTSSFVAYLKSTRYIVPVAAGLAEMRKPPL